VGGVAPRSAVPAVGAAVIAGAGAELVACPACNAQVPPGKFCAECGGGLQAAAKKMCGGCGIELLPNAKFCPECGTRSA
jgi:rRNA maturation endonuclease Nob1